MDVSPVYDLLEGLGAIELVGLVRRLIGEVERLREENARLNATVAGLRLENQQLKDEVRRLKGLPPRPPIKPSGMEKATDRAGADRPNEADSAVASSWSWRFEVEDRPHGDAGGVGAEGSRHKGYEEIIVQDIAFNPR